MNSPLYHALIGALAAGFIGIIGAVLRLIKNFFVTVGRINKCKTSSPQAKTFSYLGKLCDEDKYYYLCKEAAEELEMDKLENNMSTYVHAALSESRHKQIWAKAHIARYISAGHQLNDADIAKLKNAHAPEDILNIVGAKEDHSVIYSNPTISAEVQPECDEQIHIDKLSNIVYKPLVEESAVNTTKYETSINEIRYCRKCGNELILGSKFCSKCGFKIS